MIVRSVVERAVRMTGVDIGEIYQAANGKEALEKLDSNWIDLVFADLNMPVMTGVEMVEEMERRGMLKGTPVVIVSTDRSEMRMRELKARGVREYLNKPFTPEGIRDIMQRCLGGQGGPESVN
ncbi:MAG TPA: response regulator [Verrucomicrobia bacterium]|nr:response regulator [Verrucomicrobiota bacterium]